MDTRTAGVKWCHPCPVPCHSVPVVSCVYWVSRSKDVLITWSPFFLGLEQAAAWTNRKAVAGAVQPSDSNEWMLYQPVKMAMWPVSTNSNFFLGGYP